MCLWAEDLGAIERNVIDLLSMIVYNVCMYVCMYTIGDGLDMATMHPPPPSHLNETKFFGALGYTEHEIEC